MDCHVWETVDEYKTLERCKVPGGWLYRTILYCIDGTGWNRKDPTVSMVFVPDIRLAPTLGPIALPGWPYI